MSDNKPPVITSPPPSQALSLTDNTPPIVTLPSQTPPLTDNHLPMVTSSLADNDYQLPMVTSPSPPPQTLSLTGNRPPIVTPPFTDNMPPIVTSQQPSQASSLTDNHPPMVTSSLTDDQPPTPIIKSPPVLPQKSPSTDNQPPTITSPPLLPQTSSLTDNQPPTITSPPLPQTSSLTDNQPPTPMETSPPLPQTSSLTDDQPPTPIIKSPPVLPQKSPSTDNQPPTITSPPLLPQTSSLTDNQPPTITSPPLLPQTSSLTDNQPPTITSPPLPQTSSLTDNQPPTPMETSPPLPQTSSLTDDQPPTPIIKSPPVLPQKSHSTDNQPPTITSPPLLPQTSSLTDNQPPMVTSSPLPQTSSLTDNQPPTPMETSPPLPQTSSLTDNQPPTPIVKSPPLLPQTSPLADNQPPTITSPPLLPQTSSLTDNQPPTITSPPLPQTSSLTDNQPPTPVVTSSPLPQTSSLTDNKEPADAQSRKDNQRLSGPPETQPLNNCQRVKRPTEIIDPCLRAQAWDLIVANGYASLVDEARVSQILEMLAQGQLQSEEQLADLLNEGGPERLHWTKADIREVDSNEIKNEESKESARHMNTAETREKGDQYFDSGNHNTQRCGNGIKIKEENCTPEGEHQEPVAVKMEPDERQWQVQPLSAYYCDNSQIKTEWNPDQRGQIQKEDCSLHSNGPMKQIIPPNDKGIGSCFDEQTNESVRVTSDDNQPEELSKSNINNVSQNEEVSKTCVEADDGSDKASRAKPSKISQSVSNVKLLGENLTCYYCSACDMIFRSQFHFTRHKESHEVSSANGYCDTKAFGVQMRNVQNSGSHTQARWSERFSNSVASMVNPESKHQQAGEDIGLSKEPERALESRKRKYPCLFCEKIFENCADLKNHGEVFHNIKGVPVPKRIPFLVDRKPSRVMQIFPCAHCDKVFQFQSNYIKHLDIHQRAQLLKCSVCAKHLPNRYILQKHMEKFHFHQSKKNKPIGLQKPSKCGVANSKPISDKTSESNKSNRLVAVTCEHSDNVRKESSDVRTNRNICKKKKRYSCSDCDKRFHFKFNLIQHEMSHQTAKQTIVCKDVSTDNVKINCSENGKVKVENTGRCLKNRIPSKKQTLTPMKSGQHQCKTCLETFASGLELMEHKNSMKNLQEPYKCTVCKRSFKSKFFLHAHLRKHSNYKPFVCTICGKKIKTSYSYLQKHIRKMHQKVKPFQCDICDKSFQRLLQLTSHKKHVHFGEKLFKCDICGAHLAYPSSLTRHKKIHSKVYKKLQKPKTA